MHDEIVRNGRRKLTMSGKVQVEQLKNLWDYILSQAEIRYDSIMEFFQNNTHNENH